jgi:trimeric autotransporter adhesin
MTRNPRLSLTCVGLFLFCSITLVAQVPISVYPNPIQFGTVDQFSIGYPVYVDIGNSSSNSVSVTGITFTGAGASNFAFYGSTCVGSISGGQNCQMQLTFAPLVVGSVSANLQVAFNGTGSPLSIPLLGTGGNPLPIVTSVSPASVYVGGAAFTLTINGSNFLPSSVAIWGNDAIPTTYKSSTLITAQVPASDIGQTGEYFAGVSNPAPGGGSAGLEVQVVGLDPSINQLLPSSLVAGAGANSIGINGQNFIPGSTVLWGGKARPTTYLSSNQLQVQLSASDLVKPKIVQVSVSNPAPGGVSQALNFNVSFAATVHILNIPANDLVWDPYAQRIYASLPSSFGSNGNTIAVINPKSNGIGAYHFAGSEPTRLALSDDGKYLYAGLDGTGSVQRFILHAFTPDINNSLGVSQNNGVNTAVDLKVSPGDSHTVAVLLGASGCCENGPLEFFTDTTKLANTVSNGQITFMQFADAATLYGYDNNLLTKVNVTATGGTQARQWTGLVTGSGDIQIDSGIIYSSGGDAFNPATGDLVGVYDFSTNACCNNSLDVLTKSSVNSVFAIGDTSFQDDFGITSYNLARFTPLATINLSQFDSETLPLTSEAIQWGRNGIAFVVHPNCCGNQTSQLVLVQSAMMQPVSATSNPAPLPVSLAPASATHGSGNFKLTITGTDFVPGSQASWDGNDRTVSYVSPTELIMYIPGSDIAAAGNASVVVSNPVPGGGKASALTFAIN